MAEGSIGGSNRRAIRVAVAVVAAACLGAGSASAADIELGRHLSQECMTCHGTAKADSTIPNIYGLGEGHFGEALKAYRAKALPNPVMQSIASRLSDEDIAALAAFYETAKTASKSPTPRSDKNPRGRP